MVVVVDESRVARQKESVEKWKQNKGQGIIEANVGFGKTYTGVEFVIKPALEKGLTVLVIVPSTKIKNGWESKVKHENFKVVTVQSVYNKQKSADIIIYDEIHRYISAQWSSVLKFNCKWRLGFTGTLPKSHKYVLASYGLYVVDTIELSDSIEKGWNNEYVEYNLAVYLSIKDSYTLHNWDKLYWKLHNFLLEDGEKYVADQLLFKVPNGIKKIDNQEVFYKSGRKKGEPVITYKYPYAEKKAKSLGVAVKDVVTAAARLSFIIRTRKSLIYKYEKKLKIVEELKDILNSRKTIVFTLENAYADKVAEQIGGKSYHSKLKTKVRNQIFDEFYNAESGIIVTCNALNEGADIKGLDTMVNMAYYSTEISNNQRKGRVQRFEKGKYSVIINLVTCYHPTVTNDLTPEGIWIRRAQKNQIIKPVWVQSIKDIKWTKQT